MMNRQAKGLMITVIFLSQTFLLMPTIAVWGAIEGSELAQEGIEINAKLQETFFRGNIIGGLDGIGEEGGNKIDGNTDAYPLENAIGYASFLNRYTRSGVSELTDWSADCFSLIKSMEFDGLLKRQDEDDAYYTADQGAVLEFLSEGYKHTNDQDVRMFLETMYNAMVDLESNVNSLSPKGYSGAYWRAIDEDGEIYNAQDDQFKYCFSNVSLWALIGILSFGLTVKGQTVDLQNLYFENAVDRALEIITFLEDECFFNGSGFKEYPYSQMSNPKAHKYYFNTQVLAILAYTRLYEATGIQTYLDKANMMVEYIVTKNFLDTGNSTGCASWLSNSLGTKSDTKISYDNALYAYALIQLYEAEGETNSANLRRAEVIIKHMNDNLYKESEDGQTIGYREYLIDDKIPRDVLGGNHRLFKTNALMMLINEDLSWYERPWYVKYMMYMIIGTIAIVAIIVVIILIRKKKRVGTKIPKMVSGLIDEE